MRLRVLFLLLFAMALATAGCGSLQVEAGLAHPTAAPAATATISPPATAQVPTPKPTSVPQPTTTTVTTVPTATATTSQPTPSPVAGKVSTSDVETAVQALLDYFDAINQRNYPQAYQYWADGGKRSGQTADDFAKGYADTVQVTAQLGMPGSRLAGDVPSVSVPITLASVVNLPDQAQRVRRYQGTYELQPGEPSASGWQIVAASVAEVSAGTQAPADVADPLALLRSYVDAINQRDFARAYTYWNGLGRASQQSYPEFAQGFAGTRQVVIDLGQQQTGAAAGSVYADVPAVVVATQDDGSTRTFCGSYTARRANIPPFDQLGWHIERAHVVPTANVTPGSAEEKHLLAGGCPASADGSSGAFSQQYEITEQDNGKTFVYGVTSRFGVILNGQRYPKEELKVNCAPGDVLGAISNIPPVAPPLYAVRYEGVAPGKCTLADRDFAVTVEIRA